MTFVIPNYTKCPKMTQILRFSKFFQYLVKPNVIAWSISTNQSSPTALCGISVNLIGETPLFLKPCLKPAVILWAHIWDPVQWFLGSILGCLPVT